MAVKTFVFVLDYSYEGEEWSIEIKGQSWEEAQRKLKAIKNNKVKLLKVRGFPEKEKPPCLVGQGGKSGG